MVLVVTGELVSSYDEEFRRLYAHSTVPQFLLNESLLVPYLKDSLVPQSLNSSHLSLTQIHTRPKVMHGMRSAQDNRFNNSATLARGLSVQERLHQSEYTDTGNLVRGHSYGGELQKINSMTRLRMGTKDFGAPAAHRRSGSKQRRGGDSLLPNRMSQHHLRHQTRYGADQNLIPFNSETSLHRWKIDAYLNEDELPDASCDAISPLASPYSSYTGLNEYQSQLIHSRSRNIKSRLEETRQKRLSLQDYANLRQSQESLRSMYLTAERPKLMPSAQESCNKENRELKKRGNKKEPELTDGHRSASHHDVKMFSEQKTMQTYDWHEPLSKTASAADLDLKMNDTTLMLSHLQSSSLSVQHARVMESLTEVPEEKDSSNTRFEPAIKDRKEIHKDEGAVHKNSEKSPEREIRDQARGKDGKAAKNTGSDAPREGKKSISNEVETAFEVSKPSSGLQQAVQSKSRHTEKGQTQAEDAALQRQNSVRMKVQPVPTPDEKKASKKEEKSLQRRTSLRSRSNSGSNQPLKADHSQAPAAADAAKSLSLSMPSSQSSHSGPSETEKHKSPFSRLSPQRLSKKKTAPAAEPDSGSKSTLDEQVESLYQRKRDKVYSRYELLLSNENIRLDKSAKKANSSSSDKEKTSSLSRRDSDHPGYQAQSGADNKLGRFIQRVGSLINKNK